MPHTIYKIPDAKLEGAVRKLVVLAELSSVTFLPLGPEDVALLAGLRQTADELRDLLDGKRTRAAHDD